MGHRINLYGVVMIIMGNVHAGGNLHVYIYICMCVCVYILQNKLRRLTVLTEIITDTHTVTLNTWATRSVECMEPWKVFSTVEDTPPGPQG